MSTGLIQRFDGAGLQRLNLISLTEKSWSNDLITFFKYPDGKPWHYNIFQASSKNTARPNGWKSKPENSEQVEHKC